jgi:transcriptional regulator with XRE-family HTH domain
MTERPLRVRAHKLGLGPIGQRFKKARLERNISIIELAVACDINQTQITAYENRGVLPRINHLIAIAEVLDCTTDYLLCLQDDDGNSTRRRSVRDEAVRRLYEKLLAQELAP